ncbi:VanW family protein [Otoolea muris]|uniref:VanW family protein n=1 Tax=Otoolea muris TaxID=2941515 RepID=UPI00203EE79A|nr:VanW family protein [Otoolea muris]
MSSNYNSGSGRRAAGSGASGRSSGSRTSAGRSHTAGSGRSSGSGRVSQGSGRTGRTDYGAHTRHSQSGHSGPARYSYSSGHHGRHRRRRASAAPAVLLGAAGIIILILCISLAVKGCKGKENGGESSAEASESGSTAEETAGGEQVTVEGVNIMGLSQEAARKAILDQYNWGMKVTYQDKETEVNNLMEAKLDELLEGIYASELKPGESYEIDTANLLDAAKSEAALVAGSWNMVAKNGGISGYDKQSGKFTFTEGSNGLVIDQDKLAQDMLAAVAQKDYDAVIEAQVREVSPDTTAAQLAERYKTIGTYTTKTTSNSNRNENIRLACEALNGTIVNPGQAFSFNDTTGARTVEKGYKPATAYLNGEIVQEPGGGVCQVSSTLYNAVIFAGLKTTERKAHTYEPSYVTPGEDAAVSYGGPDFKFVNTSDYPIAIKTSFSAPELTISIYGIPILEEGTKVKMESKKSGNLDPPAPVYEEDQTLQPDEEKIVKEGVPGTSWSTYLVITKDGVEVSREFFHNSSYRGKSAQIKRNTSGVVLTTVAETTESSEAESIDANLPTSEGGPAGEGPGGEGIAPTVPAQTTGAPAEGTTTPQNPGSVNPGENNGQMTPQSPQTPQDGQGQDAPGGGVPSPGGNTPGGSGGPGGPGM